MVLYPAHHDHNHVHGRVRRHRQNQHRRITAAAVLPRGYLPVDLFFGMPEPDQQNVYREREHVRQGVFSAPRGATRNCHKQPRTPQHSNGAIPDYLCLLPYLHQRSRTPEHLSVAYARTHPPYCSPRTRFRRAVQQPHHQIPRPHIFAHVYRTALDVRNPSDLPAQHH